MLSEHPTVNVSVQSLHFFFDDHTGIPDPVTRKETIHWFRSEFERNRDLTDVVSQRQLLSAIRFMQFRSL